MIKLEDLNEIDIIRIQLLIKKLGAVLDRHINKNEGKGGLEDALIAASNIVAVMLCRIAITDYKVFDEFPSILGQHVYSCAKTNGIKSPFDVLN